MKIRYALLASVMLTSVGAFAQKSELKTLKKIYDKDEVSAKDISEYNAAISSAESLIGNAADADKVYFQYYKSIMPMLPMGLPENRQNPANVLKTWTPAVIQNIATASADVLEFEKSSGKKILTDDINDMVAMFKPMLLNAAIAAGNAGKNKEAGQILYSVYKLDTNDVDNLYYAASYAVNAQDYDNALKYYSELEKLNYSGETMSYFATNLANDKEEVFASKAERDRMITLKTHKGARQEKEPSKRGEIYKNVALILVQQNKINEAKAAIDKAIGENPDDASLMLTKADLFLQLKDTEGYKRVIGEILAKNPNDADLNFNLGVIAMQANNMIDAKKQFERVLEIDPNYTNAHINLAGIVLRGDKQLVDEINGLGTSAADNKKYDLLKKKRADMFRTVLPHLEKAHQLEPKNELVIDNLLSTYGVLEMTDKYKALKALK